MFSQHLEMPLRIWSIEKAPIVVAHLRRQSRQDSLCTRRERTGGRGIGLHFFGYRGGFLEGRQRMISDSFGLIRLSFTLFLFVFFYFRTSDHVRSILRRKDTFLGMTRVIRASNNG